MAWGGHPLPDNPASPSHTAPVSAWAPAPGVKPLPRLAQHQRGPADTASKAGTGRACSRETPSCVLGVMETVLTGHGRAGQEPGPGCSREDVSCELGLGKARVESRACRRDRAHVPASLPTARGSLVHRVLGRCRSSAWRGATVPSLRGCEGQRLLPEEPPGLPTECVREPGRTG